MNNIIITLEDDGTEAEGYEINNTQFVSAWELAPDTETPAATKAAPAKSPVTGDQVVLGVILALIALALVASAIVARRIKETRSQ